MNLEKAMEIITNTVQTEAMTVQQDRALALVQKAVAKQIAEKPIENKIFKNEIKGKTCSICHEHIAKEDKFCRHCGQKIDWSVE